MNQPSVKNSQTKPQSAGHKSPKRQAAKVFYRWHRRIGASAALFLVWLVISGLLLNHSDKLALDKVEIHSLALARWYHLTPALPQSAYLIGTHWLTQVNDDVLIDGKLTTIKSQPLIGATASEQLAALASPNELILLEPNGQLIDRLSGADLPIGTIAKLGSACGTIAISDTQKIYSSNDGLTWQECPEPLVTPAQRPLTPEEQRELAGQFTGSVSLEKLLVDLHTGHFFGALGAFFVDAVAICLLLLALSGLWLFFRMGKKQNRLQS